ncbi:MAG: arsenate reductase ArsC [Alteraurantiacibacter sp.]
MRNVLFLCTANSARSILAEAILAKAGAGRFHSFSAGSKPRGQPNPLALQLLAAKGHDIDQMRSKSWTEFAADNAPPLHAVITVCDNAKGESCPIWPMNGDWGRPVQAHWGIPDPAGEGHDGSLADFELAYRRLTGRVTAMLALHEDALEPKAWRDALIRIGRESEGATGVD